MTRAAPENSSDPPQSSSPFQYHTPTPIGRSRPPTRIMEHHATSPYLSQRQGIMSKAIRQPFVRLTESPRTLPAQPQLEEKVSAALSNRLPFVQNIQLKARSQLPDRIQSIFTYQVFNAIQSDCFSTAFETDDSLVVAAPTGSGKTVVFELAIARLISNSRKQSFKVIYQAPTKSLCAERLLDWKKKFAPFGIQCAELTGDTEAANLPVLRKASIIITTPEKWDSVTRKWKDNSELLSLVKLILIDEVHFVRDSRGATLEALVSRMKSMNAEMRFVALSATIPNLEDVAAWLGKSPQIPAVAKCYGEQFRPVKVEKFVYGYGGSKNAFAFDKAIQPESVFDL